MSVPQQTTFIDRLRAAGLITEQPSAVPRYDGPSAPAGDPRARRYAEAALRSETDIVATAPPGTRNHTLNKSAWKLGQLVEAGHLGGQEVIDALTTAAQHAGLGPAEINSTVPRAVKQAATHPRVIPPPRDETPTAHTIDPATLIAAAGENPFIPGGTFILDVPDTIPAVWGTDQDILWASGESLIIAAGNGLGKTTLAGQIVRGRLGLADTVLGLPITPGAKKVLYLAMDRPQQIRRSLRRHFTDDERHALDDRLAVWQGPPPEDLAQDTNLLHALVVAAGADTVVVDSLKDAAIGLSDDAVGAGWNRARQRVIADGCQILELHHNVKRSPNGADPSTISDIYGSAWITAGVGSAILLTGSPGDPVVQMRHVKQPANEVGPWKLIHDHDAGETTVYEPVDLVEWVRAHELVTAKDAAVALFEKDNPSAAEREKARRKLDRLVRSGHLIVVRGGGSKDPDRYDVTPAPTTYWDQQ